MVPCPMSVKGKDGAHPHPHVLTLRDLLNKYAKRCPFCNSSQLTSSNSTPMTHTCLNCDQKFPDQDAVIPHWP